MEFTRWHLLFVFELCTELNLIESIHKNLNYFWWNRSKTEPKFFLVLDRSRSCKFWALGKENILGFNCSYRVFTKKIHKNCMKNCFIRHAICNIFSIKISLWKMNLAESNMNEHELLLCNTSFLNIYFKENTHCTDNIVMLDSLRETVQTSK